MTPQGLETRFREIVGALPGSGAAVEAREAAIARFSAVGFPTRKLENWRYTDLSRLAAANYDPGFSAPPGSLAETALASVDWLDSTSAILFVDGLPLRSAGRWSSIPGLDLTPLAEAWSGGAAIGAPDYEAAPLAALNTAFASDGLSIRARAGQKTKQPLHLCFCVSGRRDIAPQPRLSIRLEADSELAVVLYLSGNEAVPTWTNLVSEIVLEPRSRLTLLRVQDSGSADIHTELLSARVEEDAKLEAGCVDLGGDLVRNDIQIELAGDGAACDLFGLFLAADGQHVDNHVRVDHAAPHTTSHETFKGIVGDRGRGVFNGKVVVHRDAQKIDASQSSDNLLLSDRAEIDTKPELEIYADDVKCSHGATVGQLDEAQLFYLRSRGLSDAAARSLLTFAFGNEILQRLSVSEIRQPVTRRFLERLPGAIGWDELL